MNAVLKAVETVQGGSFLALELESCLADFHGVLTSEVLVGNSLLERVFGTFGCEGTHILLAEPTTTRAINAAIACEARYVDAGRDFRFQISQSGWRAVLKSKSTCLAYLATPDEPTSTRPSGQRLHDARDASVPVLLDCRFESILRPTRPRPGVWVLNSLDVCAGVEGLEYLVAPSDMLASLRQGDQTSTSYHMTALNAAVTHLDEMGRRARRWNMRRQKIYTLLKEFKTVMSEPPRGPGVWMRVPGTPSEEIARRIDHPLVLGSDSWTWRDAVRLIPPSNADERKQLLDALRGAL